MTPSSSPRADALPSAPGVTIRPAFPDDAPAVARLAALDSQRVPAGALLLAEIDGEPWAAVALETARVIADPFRPTAALVDLLRRRCAQLTAAQEVAGRGPGRRRAQVSFSDEVKVVALPSAPVIE